MNMVAVISASGKKLMPTNSYRARRLLKSGKAQIYQYRPIFTIQLLERKDGYTQPIEYACDTGYQHIGISIKSQKHEFVNEQHYSYRPNDVVWYEGQKYLVKGVQDKGKRIALQDHLPVAITKIEKCIHTNGWCLV